MKLYKYSGAGNDFIVLDGRNEEVSGYREAGTISSLCDRKGGFVAADGRQGADGLMILGKGDHAAGLDFTMEYFNADGSGGMMCGNGGRCIAAFADHLGIKPANGEYLVFSAADGLHTGEVLARNGNVKTIRIKMIDVSVCKAYSAPEELAGGWFLDTGTRHYVKFVPDVEDVDVENEGKALRWHPEFAPIGANINFVSIAEDGVLHVRTFEKGVEAETLACGTGITASAIAAYLRSGKSATDRVHYAVRARIDDLAVDFIPASPAREVYLTGPAELI